MQILTYRIQTAMGSVTPWGCDKLDFLSPEEAKELDTIGYTGKNSKGIPTGREGYLNSLGKGTFKVDQTKRDSGDFVEEFTITRVI
jgi:hypothetical protein